MEVSYALAPPGAPPATKARLVRALEDWDVVAAAEVLEEEGGRGWVEEHGWELVAVVAAHLTPHTEEAGPHLSACCQALLTTLATRVTSAKEVLVALLEQVEELASSLCVTRLLPALSLTLLRLRPRSMSHSWAWALATLTSHLAKAPEPPCRGLEAAERLATDLGEEAREGAHLAAAAVDLVEPLVEFVAKQEGEEGENSRRREVLVRFLVQMLGRPLSVLPQHPEGEVRPATWGTMARAAACLARLHPDLLTLQVVAEQGEQVEEFGLATLHYWVLGEGEGSGELPQVYSHPHLLLHSSPHALTLLTAAHEIRVHKGLLLLHRRLSTLPAASLPPSLAQHPALTALLPALARAAVHQDTAELRRLAFACYRLLLGATTLEARYHIFLLVINSVTHPGLLGWTVTQVKDAVASSLPPSTPCSLYQGASLLRLLSPLYTLEKGAETDLLELSDLVVATTNLSVLLLARDPADSAGVRASLVPRAAAWARQVAAGLDMAVAHYRRRLAAPTVGPEVGVEVGGAGLPAMDPRQQAQVLGAALNTFDIVRFNLVRLQELLGL